MINARGRPKKPTRTLAERLAEFTPSASLDVCWLWMGTHFDADGYGVISRGGYPVRAHRAAYMVAHGIVMLDANIIICHRCDVRSCVNPSHLFAGTQQDNVRDRDAKHRHPAVKLNADLAKEIRTLVAGGCSQTAVAARFGVTPGSVSRIVAMKIYKELPGA